MKRIFERCRADFVSLLWLGTGLFLAVALATYSPHDPSLNSFGGYRIAKNLCGLLGSFISDALYQSFGLAAWVVIWAAVRRVRKTTRPGWLDLLAIPLIASLLTLHFESVRFFENSVRVGGWLGHIFSKGLIWVLNPVGSGILLWTIAAAVFVAYFDRERLLSLRVPIPRILPGIWGALKVIKWQSSSPKVVINSPPEPKTSKSLFKLKRHDFNAKIESKIEVPEDEPLPEEISVPIAPRIQLKRGTVRAPRRVENWQLPKLSLLEDPPAHLRAHVDEREVKAKARLLVEKLGQFSVRGEVVGIKPGPAVTMFEFKPAADVKISKITELADDLSLALSSESVRIIAPIPGRDVVGIETSNSSRETVFVKDIVSQEEFWSEECRLPVALGRKADGEARIVDLRKMPHLLVAGSTGSGKSVFVVSMITSLLFRHSPKTLRLILVDPKQVDLAAFGHIPHLVMPPIREPRKAVGALRWAIKEMEKRYRSMSKFGARGLESFNEIAADLKKDEVQSHQEYNAALDGSFHPDAYYFQSLPYIVIVVEEFGDLMAVDKVNVEQAVVRLAQMARACGIHLVLAMQSPRKDVVTGLIKTNIPGRISFKVASKMDSRIILDEAGAERLLARGDMLFLAPGVAKPERHHGPFLSEDEIQKIVESWRVQGEPEYDLVAMKAIEGSGGGFDLSAGDGHLDPLGDGDDIQDERYDEVLAWVASQQEVSASLLQRRFRLGYPRAARMIEIFESEGVVGPANGSKPRQVLVREMPK